MSTAPQHIPALQACDLSLSWDGYTPVVERLSFLLAEGEICCLVGRSGSGKTTLLHALAGLTKPLSGKVLLFGEDITATPGALGYMLQKDLLLPNKTVIDNVCLPLTLKGTGKQEAYKKAIPLLERFGLADSKDLWPHELSGGMRQRAAFLRTYLTGARVVLLDEPFSALDAITRDELRTWFLAMVRELSLSVLIITHDVDEALLLGDRVCVLKGNPAHGQASTLAGEVLIKRGAHTPSDATLSHHKKRILNLL